MLISGILYNAKKVFYYNGEPESKACRSSVYWNAMKILSTGNIEYTWPLSVGFDIYRDGKALLLYRCNSINPLNYNVSTLERKTDIVMAWLQIAVGLIILGIAGYRFVRHGYSFETVNIVVTFVLGIFLPLMAAGRLMRFKNEERKSTDQNDEIQAM